MRIDLEVRIGDTPGKLIELIKPISNNGGNIFAVWHNHENKINNMIPVRVEFDLPEELKETSLKNIKKELKEQKIQIKSLTMDEEMKQIVVILSGHVFDTDIVNTIDRLASKDIFVSELKAIFTEMNEISNVKLKLNVNSGITREKVFEELDAICEEKDLFLIRS
jgi:ACT domain-containing protein